MFVLRFPSRKTVIFVLYTHTHARALLNKHTFLKCQREPDGVSWALLKWQKLERLLYSQGIL